MTMRNTIIVLLAVVASVSAALRGGYPQNSMIVWEDSLRLDSTETKRMTAAWTDNGAQLALLVEARNDSTVGLASDSASAQIKLFQLFPVRKGDAHYFVRLNSRAHPDSTTSLLAGGTDFVLWDSLHVASMDTQSVYLRNKVLGSAKLNRPFEYGDSLKTLQATSVFGGFAYKTFAIDYSPAIELEVTGNLANGKRGVGSVWKFRLFQLGGTKVKVE